MVILLFANSYLTQDWRNILILLVFFIIVRIYKALLICIWNVERKRKIMLFARIVDMLIQVGVIVFIIFRNSLSVSSVLIASIFGNSFSVIVFILSYKNLISFQYFKLETFKSVFSDIFKYSLPLIFWGIFLWAQNMIGRWYIDIFLNKTDVANYSIMTTLALIPGTAIVALVGQFVVPIVYVKENQNYGYISSTNKKIVLLSLVFWIFVIIVTYFLKDILIQIFLDKKYINVSWSLPLLMIGTAAYSIGQVLIYEIYYYKKPDLLLIANILPGLFSIIFGFFIIKNFGFVGAVYTYVVSYVISGIMTLIIVARFSKSQKISFNNQ